MGWACCCGALLLSPASSAGFTPDLAGLDPTPTSGGGSAEKIRAKLPTCFTRLNNSRSSRLAARLVAFTAPRTNRGSLGRGMSIKISANMRER